jgi:hypothetical protein
MVSALSSVVVSIIGVAALIDPVCCCRCVCSGRLRSCEEVRLDFLVAAGRKAIVVTVEPVWS